PELVGTLLGRPQRPVGSDRGIVRKRVRAWNEELSDLDECPRTERHPTEQEDRGQDRRPDCSREAGRHEDLGGPHDALVLRGVHLPRRRALMPPSNPQPSTGRRLPATFEREERQPALARAVRSSTLQTRRRARANRVARTTWITTAGTPWGGKIPSASARTTMPSESSWMTRLPSSTDRSAAASVTPRERKLTRPIAVSAATWF